MPEVILKFKRTKIIELTFNRELTEEEIDKIEADTFDPDSYKYNKNDVTHEESDRYDTEFDEMEFVDYEAKNYDCIFSVSNIDSYREYLKKQEELEQEEEILAKDPNWIKPHGQQLFKEEL